MAVAVALLLKRMVPLLIKLPETVNLLPAAMVKVLLALMVRSLHAKSVLVVKSPSIIASIEEVGALFYHDVV